MKQKIFVLSFVLAFAIVAMSCKENKKHTKTSEVIKMITAGDYGLPNPYRHAGRGAGVFKMQLIYDSLIEKGEEGDIPWLAKSWQVNEDGTEIIFHLVENATWHDGKPLTANDVAFTFAYIEKHPPRRLFTLDKGKSIIASVETIDDYTVKLKLKNYSPAYLSRIGMVRILPQHIWENVADPLSFNGEGVTVGSGPYLLDNYTPEQGLYRFVAFENYWGRKPVASAIEYIPVSDRVLALENGEIHISPVTPDTMNRFEKKANFKTVEYNTQHAYRLYFNFLHKPAFADKNIRQAMAYAIDRQSMVDKIERGFGEVAPMGYLYSGHSYYNPQIAAYDYNLEKAKELMAGQSIEVDMLIGNSPKEVKVAELLKLDLEKINITLNITSMERKARDATVKKNNYDLALIYYGGMGGDPTMLKDIYYSFDGKKGGSIPGYSNKELDKILDAQSIEKDDKKRRELINKAQEIIAEDVPMLLLYADIQICTYDKTVNDSWVSVYDHSRIFHPKISFVEK